MTCRGVNSSCALAPLADRCARDQSMRMDAGAGKMGVTREKHRDKYHRSVRRWRVSSVRRTQRSRQLPRTISQNDRNKLCAARAACDTCVVRVM